MIEAARGLIAASVVLLSMPALAQEPPAGAPADSPQETGGASTETEPADTESGAPQSDAGGEADAAAEESDTAAQTENATEAQGPGDLSMGAPAEDGVGTTYVRDSFGDWEMRCIRTGETREPCQLYQLLQDEEGNSVAEISLAPLPGDQEAAAGATVVTPLETLLTAQLRLSVDGGQARRYPFTWCSAVGCFSRIGFTDAEVDQFKRGASATIGIRPVAAPDQEVPLTVSLSGFTAGYDAVEANNAAE